MARRRANCQSSSGRVARLSGQLFFDITAVRRAEAGGTPDGRDRRRRGRGQRERRRISRAGKAVATAATPSGNTGRKDKRKQSRHLMTFD